jgi:hypothetical protein
VNCFLVVCLCGFAIGSEFLQRLFLHCWLCFVDACVPLLCGCACAGWYSKRGVARTMPGRGSLRLCLCVFHKKTSVARTSPVYSSGSV